MKNLIFFLLGIAVLLLNSSCNSDDEIEDDIVICVQDELTDGLLIVNEGPFNSGTGTITALDNNTELIEAIFQRNNCDEELGNIVQSLLIHDNQIFIVVNNADKIVVANAQTFELVGNIEGLQLPRYLVAGDNDRLYLSQWGSDGVSGKLSEIDPANLSVTRELDMRSGPEEILFHEGKIYVPHVGGFGRDSVLSVVDVDNWNVPFEIVVGDNPQSVIAQGNNIWCLSSGYFDFMTYETTPGAISQINNFSVTQSLPLDNGVTNLTYQPNLGMLYWLNFAGIQRMPVVNGTPEDFVSGGYNDLTLDQGTNQLYACDAGNFQDPGQVFRIETSSGVVLDSIAAGVIPSEVYFY